jgi:hypothetical protein
MLEILEAAEPDVPVVAGLLKSEPVVGAKVFLKLAMWRQAEN